MYGHRNKNECGDAEITDRWSAYRGMFPDPSREELKLIEKFLCKFAWECDDFDESSRDCWISLKDRLQCPNLAQLLRKFVRQVRSSKGYDVDLYFDFIVHPYPVFIPRNLDDKKFYDEAMAAANFAIQQINSSTMRVGIGKTLEVVSVDKMVSTTHKIIRTITNMLLLTFTAREVFVSTSTTNVVDSDIAVVKTTIQAMIKLCDQPPSSNFLLKEWKYKPVLME